MTAEPRTTEPDIWLQEYEAGGRADCGCSLESTGPDGMLGAALYYCPMHDAAPETAAERDRLRAINETLTEALAEMLNQYADPTDVGWRKWMHDDARAALAAAREEEN